jgi:hypothetical protein
VRARSADGLSAAAFELESWGLLVHAAYGYVNRLPFSSYGEAAILLAQNLLLLALVYRYARLPAARVGAVAALLAAAVAVLASGGWQGPWGWHSVPICGPCGQPRAASKAQVGAGLAREVLGCSLADERPLRRLNHLRAILLCPCAQPPTRHPMAPAPNPSRSVPRPHDALGGGLAV